MRASEPVEHRRVDRIGGDAERRVAGDRPHVDVEVLRAQPLGLAHGVALVEEAEIGNGADDGEVVEVRLQLVLARGGDVPRDRRAVRVDEAGEPVAAVQAEHA